MAWTIDEFVNTMSNFIGEIIAEFGDVETSAFNPEQKQVTLYATEANSPKAALRSVEAWDYAQAWADRSGRPVRLCISGVLTEGDETATGNWGVKTFQPRIVGGDEKNAPLPTKAAFSDETATAFIMSANEFGTWHVPYGSQTKEVAYNRLSMQLQYQLENLPTKLASVFHDVFPGFTSGHCCDCPPCTCSGKTHSAHSPKLHHYEEVSRILWDFGLTTEEFQNVWTTTLRCTWDDLRSEPVQEGATFKWTSCFSPDNLANAVKTVIGSRVK